MGKRELLIALAFIAAGALAYQLTAPPTKPGRGRLLVFAISGTTRPARMRANVVQGQFTHTGAIPVSAGHEGLRIIEVPTAAGARSSAKPRPTSPMSWRSSRPALIARRRLASRSGSTLKQDDLGHGLDLVRQLSADGRQVAVSRCTCRLGSASLSPDGAASTSRMSLCALRQRRRRLPRRPGSPARSPGAQQWVAPAKDVESVKMTLQRSRATFDHVEAGLTLDLRDGECHIADSKGAVDIDESGRRDDREPARPRPGRRQRKAASG